MSFYKTTNGFESRGGGHYVRLLSLLILFSLFASPVGAVAEEAVWHQRSEQGDVSVRLYFFWSAICPHCDTARPVVEEYAKKNPWLELVSLEVSRSRENRERYRRLAATLGMEARSVPAFIYCGQMRVGFEPGEFSDRLFSSIEACRERLASGEGMLDSTSTPSLPMGVQQGEKGLFTLTVLIAALDAFNPCAFFVLVFLLGMLGHAESRKRMLMVGGTFVLFSGVLYFLFMSAWLNLFLLMGVMRPVTIAAAVVALLAAALNIKDAIRPGEGLSLSIPDDRKPGLFRRMRGLLKLESTPGLLLATVVLALMANSYELLCTSGLPMVYTRILTLEALPSIQYYLYLLLYNLVYVTPLAIIVVLFVLGVARGKLQALGGRLLKLLSGLMMLGLGAVLLVAPEWLSQPLTTLWIIGFALLITLLLRQYWRQD